jgi:hypothetical protein
LETANNEDEFQPLLKAYFNDWRVALTNIYNEVFDKTKAKTKATKFLNELNGAILMMKLYNDKIYLEDFIKYKLEEI